MTERDVPLQHDMFSGALVDTRTYAQKQVDKILNRPKQLEMFRQKDLAQFGVSAHPVMDVSPGRLVLISEDPRTDEEKEEAIRQEAKARTRKMFELSVNESSQAKPAETAEDIQSASGTADSVLPTDANKADDPKLTAYLELVQVVHEQLTTIWVAEDYRNRFFSQVPLAVLNAQGAGLTTSEIMTALQVGQFLELPKIQSPKTTSGDENVPQRVAIRVDIDDTPKPVMYEAPRGYRKYARQHGNRLCTRRKLPKPLFQSFTQ